MLFVRERNVAVMQAYYAAALSRWDARRRPFPKLHDLLRESTPKRQLTDDELWQRNLAIAKAHKAMK